MKIKLSLKREVQLRPEVLEEKINRYLKKNDYRIVERGSGFIIFIDDVYSDRKRSRSDFTRIEEGKFVFHSTGEGTNVKLIYLTSILYQFFLMMVFVGAGMYGKSYILILFSFAFFLPIVSKIYSLKEHVFDEILKS